MIAGEVPDNARWSEVLGPSKMQHLLDDLGSGGLRMGARDRTLIDEAGLALPFKRSPPTVEPSPADAKIPTGLPDIPHLLRVFQYLPLSSAVLLRLGDVCLLLER